MVSHTHHSLKSLWYSTFNLEGSCYIETEIHLAWASLVHFCRYIIYYSRGNHTHKRQPQLQWICFYNAESHGNRFLPASMYHYWQHNHTKNVFKKIVITMVKWQVTMRTPFFIIIHPARIIMSMANHEHGETCRPCNLRIYTAKRNILFQLRTGKFFFHTECFTHYKILTTLLTHHLLICFSPHMVRRSVKSTFWLTDI